MPATADRAISSIDLSALLIRKLVSRTVVIVPITPPVSPRDRRPSVEKSSPEVVAAVSVAADQQHVEDADDQDHGNQTAERPKSALKYR